MPLLHASRRIAILLEGHRWILERAGKEQLRSASTGLQRQRMKKERKKKENKNRKKKKKKKKKGLIYLFLLSTFSGFKNLF